jgi:hypothetical protein
MAWPADRARGSDVRRPDGSRSFSITGRRCGICKNGNRVGAPYVSEFPVSSGILDSKSGAWVTLEIVGATFDAVERNWWQKRTAGSVSFGN